MPHNFKYATVISLSKKKVCEYLTMAITKVSRSCPTLGRFLHESSSIA